MSTTGSVSGKEDKGKGKEPTPKELTIGETMSLLPKVQTPNTFDGKRSELKVFLMKAELYIRFNAAKFSTDREKIL